MKRLALALASFAVLACGEPSGSNDLVTTLTPPPGPFNDRVTVRLTSNVAATIFVTTDGTDAHNAGINQRSGPSPLDVELTKSTTLTFFARSSDAEEAMRSVQYVRAGGARGTVSGVIVVDTLAIGKAVQLTGDNAGQTFAALPAKGEIPFTLTGLQTGAHRLRAIADRDANGLFLPFLDDSSDPYDYEIDLADPFKSNIEGVKLFLGASPSGLCTLAGTLTIEKPAAGQFANISALSPSAFTSGAAGGDFTGLLAQLQNGYQILAMPPQTEYPYAITGLEPGQYMGVPLLTTFGLGGIGLNVIANPMKTINCRAGETARADFVFGPIGITGKVTLTPATPPEGFVYGIVAAKSSTLSTGIQAVLMPALFIGGVNDSGELVANYAGQGLRGNANFAMRAFTSADGSEPLTAAFAWAVNPFASEPPQATVHTVDIDVVQDFALP